MKTQSNWLVNGARTLFVIGILAAAFSPLQTAAASPLADDFVVNPAAEQYVEQQLLSGNPADLINVFPNESQRVISGGFLSELIVNPALQDKPEIYIASAVIIGDVFDAAANLPFEIIFHDCHFIGRVDFDRTELQSIHIEYSVIEGAIRMDRAIVNGDFSLVGSTMEQAVGMYGIEISGDLLGYDAKFNATKPDGGMSFPNEFWTIEVGNKVYFSNAIFKGEVFFEESQLYALDFYGTTFKDEASFQDTTVATNAIFNDTKFEKTANFKNFSAENFAYFNGTAFSGEVSFEKAIVTRHADFSNATFNGDANFDYFTAERFIDFVDTTFNKGFSFSYTTVGMPYFKNVTFNGPTYFDGMRVAEDFEISNSSYNYAEEPVFFYLINVVGSVWLYEITAPAGIHLTDSHIGDLEIKTQDNPEIAVIDLTDTKIDAELKIENVRAKSLLAEGLSVSESTHLTNVNVTESLDLRNAKIGFLKVDEFKWPEDPSAFNLRGMTFTDIDLGNKGLTEETWQGLLQLVNTSAYSPQAYKALVQFFIDKGHSDWAAEIELAGKRRERDEMLKPFTGAWLWSWFLDIFSGYGQRPFLAFIWSALVVVIGALTYRRKEDMLPIDQDDAKLEYNPIWYSFGLFLPYIDIGIASKWEPNPQRKWARNYKYVHMLLGWILLPIALLTFGGVF